MFLYEVFEVLSSDGVEKKLNDESNGKFCFQTLEQKRENFTLLCDKDACSSKARKIYIRTSHRDQMMFAVFMLLHR